MIVIEKQMVGEIPLLNVAKREIFHEKLPTVIFQHGITSAMEHNLAYAYLLADKGFRTVLPDALHHGERENGINSFERNLSFWEIVVNGIFDVERIVNHYIEKGEIDPKRIGMAGTSMGGIITFGVLNQFPWIKAAVSLMGLPNYVAFASILLEQLKKDSQAKSLNWSELEQKVKELEAFDLTKHAERLNERPLLIWHSVVDQVVPFQLTNEFYETVKGQYVNQPEHLRMLIDQRSGHKVPRAATLATVEWLTTHL